MRAHIRLLPLLLFASSLLAKADTLTTFDLTSTLTGPTSGTLDGVVTIDVTTGSIENADLTATTGTNPLLPGIGGKTYSFVGTPEQYSTSDLSLFELQDSDSSLLRIYLPASFQNYTGSYICSTTQECSEVNGDQVVSYLQPVDSFVWGAGSGSLTPEAYAPEPSSLALLGTGLMGVGAALKRRIA